MVSHGSIESQIQATGHRLFDAIGRNRPSFFQGSRITAPLLDACLADPEFKRQLLQFVDVYPTLDDKQELYQHLTEYFPNGNGSSHQPALLDLAIKTAGRFGSFGKGVASFAVEQSIKTFSRQFILAATPQQALPKIKRLNSQGYGTILDLLGEAAVSESETAAYQKLYLESLDTLANDIPQNATNFESAPTIQISVKPTSLYSSASPLSFDHTVKNIVEKLLPICQRAKELGALVAIDMESRQYKNLTIEIFKRLRSSSQLADWPHLCLVLQAYLKETSDDVDTLLVWAKDQGQTLNIRLVKGAYWEFECAYASQHNWPIPVWQKKQDTDFHFERLTQKLLQNHEHVYYACASHNIRSIAATMEWARHYETPPDRYEFQALYGMAEPIRASLLEQTSRIRLYCPVGDVIPGMAYLVRRLLENTSNDSFLRQRFADQQSSQSLLSPPRSPVPATPPKRSTDFQNSPLPDFTKPQVRDQLPQAIAHLRACLNSAPETPLLIGSEQIRTSDTFDSLNPNAPNERIATVSIAQEEHIAKAIQAAKKASGSWAKLSFAQRTDLLKSAAAKMSERLWELSALQVLETGKQWSEALGDVAEAIDFLNYYAQQALRFDTPSDCGKTLGESNQLHYRPRGIATVIAPWNFPLAISCGMTAAALVTGNPVLYKPSSQSARIGYEFVRLMLEAGFPPGALNYLPGSGQIVGNALANHPEISTIAFTGSRAVGMRLIQSAANPPPDAREIKRVICEMGGKNAILIDSDADLDEAIPAILYSAFGYQGQKCSACSRLIVLESIYSHFVKRFKSAVAKIRVGPAEDPRNDLGAVIDASAQRKILEYIEIGKDEASLLYQSEAPEYGYFVPLTVFEKAHPNHRLAQEEIFGPVLSIVKAPDFETAIKYANDTPYALTGGLFSRSPQHIALAREKFDVGNLYINRGITGAMVERHPFGGHKFSGLGTKAGGPDYLLQFLNTKSISENTIRHGFVG
ncbi:proline dehydrogenase family protein [Pelagicoccus mobilis]|uniref:L-glutamate gamma-semialdehyde dehydrogenase n=1 Tax=Pelagicoccus mobilis TaxID=415221 RepID=A0A934VR81_9BACT|nr:proline dehydrogenase family protein [Pelagicoccus mobilis]MBK1877264.1 proline dehydrogenase family protein [Pelagicoccus mobilis]